MPPEPIVELVHYAFEGNCRSHDATTTVILEDVSCADCQDNLQRKTIPFKYTVTIRRQKSDVHWYRVCLRTGFSGRNYRLTKEVREVDCTACLEELSKAVHNCLAACLKHEARFAEWRKNWIGFWATLGEAVKVWRPRPTLSPGNLADDATMKRFQLVELD